MEFLKDILYIVITAAVPLLTTYICKFLYEKWTEGKTKIKNEEIASTLDNVVSMVLNCVETTNQTFVDELKKNGEFTKEAAAEAFLMSKTMAIQMLSEDAAEIILEVYGDIDVYLDTLIETTVKRLKD